LDRAFGKNRKRKNRRMELGTRKCHARKKKERYRTRRTKKKGKQRRMASRRSGRPKVLDIRKFWKNRKKVEGTIEKNRECGAKKERKEGVRRKENGENGADLRLESKNEKLKGNKKQGR